MRIALLFDDKGIYNVNFSDPRHGNPGVSGTHYCFILLAYYLKKYYQDIEVIIYHYNENCFPRNTLEYKINNKFEAIKLSKRDKVDILIFKCEVDNKFYKLIDKCKINSIAWAHNYIITDILNVMNECNYLKRIVFVGKQQYDRYIDNDIINKSEFIYNMYPPNNEEFTRNENNNKIVTYTGSIIPQKGFHILAKQWKKILKEVPDAKLYVIGSGQLYDRNLKLGEYNIASKNYEDKFIKYLLDDNGEILDSVRFLGTLGIEKINYYKDTTVGVVNPSARTETYCISAVEMEALGIPIVSKKKNGLPDTVKNRKTGYLTYTNRGLRKKIIKLLKNNNLNNEFSENAKIYVNKFEPKAIIDKWYNVFNDIVNGKKCTISKVNNYYFNNLKIIRIINSHVRKIGFLSKIPSLVEVEIYIRNNIINNK